MPKDHPELSDLHLSWAMNNVAIGYSFAPKGNIVISAEAIDAAMGVIKSRCQFEEADTDPLFDLRECIGDAIAAAVLEIATKIKNTPTTGSYNVFFPDEEKQAG